MRAMASSAEIHLKGAEGHEILTVRWERGVMIIIIIYYNYSIICTLYIIYICNYIYIYTHKYIYMYIHMYIYI